MFSSRAFPRLARLLRTSRPFSASIAMPRVNQDAWRLPGYLGLLAGGALLYAWDRPTQAADSFADVLVCKVTDLAEGVPRQVQVGSDPENYIVVAKVGGAVYAVSGKCAHYGAPMAEGFLDGYHLFCPWHAAAFDIRSGEIFDAPAVDSLTPYKARIAPNGDVLVSIPEAQLSEVSRARPSRRLVKPDGSDSRTFVIVGGGGAGHSCAESLRRSGFRGKIVLLSESSLLPYDSSLLTKAIKADPNSFTLRPAEFYSEYGIEVRLGVNVKGVDTKKKTVKMGDGQEVKYDKLCLATGSRGRVTGSLATATKNVKGVFTLRCAGQLKPFQAALEKGNNIVIVGASFQGLELAASIRRAYPNKKVTLIDAEEKPLTEFIGPAIARQLLDSQHKNGIMTLLGQRVSAINEADGCVKSVTVDIKSEFKAIRQEELPADVVFVATRNQANTSFVPYHLLNQDGSVRVDTFLRSDDPHVFAAGDIASYHSYISQASQHSDFWGTAQDQGRVAAENMLGLGQPFNSVPHFYTNQFSTAQVVGFTTTADWVWTETDSEDEPEKTARITYFYKGERCVGAATINKPGAIQRLRVALMRNLMPSRHELTTGAVKYANIAATVEATRGGKWGPGRRRFGQAAGHGCGGCHSGCQAKK